MLSLTSEGRGWLQLIDMRMQIAEAQVQAYE